ncbi:Metallo-dependent hydrolase [Terfezia boudieri ATCC MYA-4762]|uniref:Metallo-dependent hydrolase n=1 Tax=Terfezia boudieri ATCC MYA-4762 TaxID=1051890 RepID=A0A3N4MLC3_9PEZI|nr:Metallo-dependent hydrolase [Terfezia boudieri ATCC MYA-4762]
MNHSVNANPKSPSTSHIPIPDSHCHPTDTPSLLPTIPSMRASCLTAMSTNSTDQSLVLELAEKYPERVVPGFGWHPWFSYLVWDDEDPELLALWETGEEGWEGEFTTRHFEKVLKGGGGGGGGPGNGGRLEKGFVEALGMPRRLRGDVVVELRRNFERFKSQGRGVVLGEVGLDRGFRLPWPKGYRPPASASVSATVSEEGEGEKEKALSPYKVSMHHQVLVFIMQMKVAGEVGVPASVHGVQAHGTMFDTLRGLWKGWEVRVESRREMRERVVRGRKLGGKEREWVDRFLLEDGKGLEELDSDVEGDEPPQGPPPFPPRICLHSFSAPPQTLSQYLSNPTPTTAYPSEVYFSFSTTINSRNKCRLEEVLGMVPQERVLVESDLHTAGEEMDRVLEGAVEVVRGVKGWSGEEVRRVVGENWGRWVYGEEWDWRRRRRGQGKA